MQKVLIFILGIFVGYGVFQLLGKQKTELAKISDAPVVSTVKPKISKSSKAMQVKKGFEILGVQKLEQTVSIKPIEKKIEKRVLTLDISEEQLNLLEAQREEIRRDLALIKDNDGWTVRVEYPNPLVSSLGFENGDYIRFTQFQQLKRTNFNPESFERLESIFQYLER